MFPGKGNMLFFCCNHENKRHGHHDRNNSLEDTMNRRHILIPAAIILILSVPMIVSSAPQGSPMKRQYGKGYPFQLSDLPPGQLRSAIEALPPQAKVRAKENLHKFSFPHQDIEHIRTDKDGGIFYICNMQAHDTLAEEAGAAEVAPVLSFDPAKVFSLHSRPGSQNIVFLNFEGGVISGTAWSSGTLNALPYDIDGNPSVFSEAERRIIADIWHRVSEDMAPFDIDVTTERPAGFGPKVGHVMITRNRDANNLAMPSSSAGGVAYVGVWGRSDYATRYSPAFVYYNNLGTTNSHYISEAASHEFGHNLSLSHDGTSTSGYYQGHGTGDVSWAPIMGVGYYRQVTQWSRGEYPDANNPQDDIAIIAGKLTYRADDHGAGMAGATMLAVDPDGTVWSSNPEDDPENIYPENKGVIVREADTDYFAFDHAGGPVSFIVTPAWDAFYAARRGANLDIQAGLYSSQGAVLAQSDPVTDTVATVSVTAGPGRYYLAVTGVGNSVTPYSSYGSLGQYFINGNVTASALRADFTYTTSGLTAAFTDASTDTDGTINSWTWTFGDGISSYTQHPSRTYANGGSYTVTLTVTDNKGRTANTSRVVTVTGPNSAPAANFGFSVSGSTAFFTDSSSDSDGTIVSRSWNFGDGGYSTQQNPSHTYASVGSYSVTLTVTDNNGASGSIQKAVEVVGPPVAPSNLTATVTTSRIGKTTIKTAKLQWQDNSSNETSFTLQRCTETGKGAGLTCNYSDLSTVGANTTTFTNTPGSGNYRYRIRANNSNGSSAYSNEVRI